MKELFKKIFNPKKELFPELTPSERIRKIIEVYIFPDLEKLGFKMHKSTLSMTRKVGEFKQEIHFPKNKRNQGNETVMFDLIFNVSFPKYTKWHLQTYHTEPKNDGVAGARACYIANWKKDLFENSWYDLVQNDNTKIVELVKFNILNSGIDYFESYSTKQKTIRTTLATESHFYRCPLLFDFALMENDKEQAEKIIRWFDDFASKKESDFNKDLVENVKVRKQRLEVWS